MQGWIDNPKELQKFLRGLCPPPVVAPTPEPPLDFLVRVDRSVKPTYPNWMKKVMHPELEGTGPAEYNLETQVEEWLHDDQKSEVIHGQVIYDYLKKRDMLADQLGLADLLAIQAKGIKVFRNLFKSFKSKAVFGWRSVVEVRNGHLDVPCLYEDGDWVVLSWRWLDNGWDSRRPALRFGK